MEVLGMKKLISTAKVLDAFAGILQVMSLVAAIILVVSIVMLSVFNVEAYAFSATIELGHFSFGLSSFDPQTVQQQFLWMALPAVAVLVALHLISRVIRSILKPMKEGRPFDTAVSANLRKLSWIVLIGGGVSSLAQLAAEAAMYRLFDFSSLFLSDRITSCTLTWEPDTTFVFLFLILFLLSCVFRYGEELQAQSDETL